MSRSPWSTGGIAAVLVLLACGALGLAAGPGDPAGGEAEERQLPPVVEASPLEDPWTATYLGLGFKVYAARAAVEGKEVLDGAYRVYAPNGVLVVEGAYWHGLPEGEFRYWYESGFPSNWITYARGREVGTSVSLYENGRPQRICYRNMKGDRDGAEAYWDAEGRLQASMLWAEGHPQQLVLYQDGVPSETLTGEAAEERTLKMMREASAKLWSAGTDTDEH